MELDRKELKRRARAGLRETTPAPWRITLLFMLLTNGVSSVVELVTGSTLVLSNDLSILNLFLYFLILLYSTVMTFGYDLWSLRASRAQPTAYSTLIEGFSMVGRVVVTRLLVALYTFFWALATALPASLVMSLMLFSSPLPLSYGGVILMILVMVVVAAGISIAISLRYALTSYLLADYPDDGAAAAVRRSVSMMRGWKWELFKLHFSFVGWEVLSGLLVLGAVFAVTSGAVVQLYLEAIQSTGDLTAFQALLLAPKVSLVSALASLPVGLYLGPYRALALAHFYTARASVPQQDAPPL